MTTITRRTAIAGGIAASTIIATSPTLAGTDPDRAVFALVERFIASEDAMSDFCRTHLDEDPPEWMGDRSSEILAELVATPAQTPAGILAKFRALARWTGNFDEGETNPLLEDRLLRSMVRDTERLAGGAS